MRSRDGKPVVSEKCACQYRQLSARWLPRLQFSPKSIRRDTGCFFVPVSCQLSRLRLHGWRMKDSERVELNLQASRRCVYRAVRELGQAVRWLCIACMTRLGFRP
jgi:hypothetical protein